MFDIYLDFFIFIHFHSMKMHAVHANTENTILHTKQSVHLRFQQLRSN
jgi:hypothetical protein